MSTLSDLIQTNQLWYCLDCGKCGSTCPVSVWETRTFTSPRTLIEKSLHGGLEEAAADPLFWSCLTCQRCSVACPSNVRFPEFVRAARGLAGGQGRPDDCTHSGMIQTWGRMMTNPAMRQNRLGWVEEDLKFSDTSDTLYFVGCAPYYDPVFKKLGAEGVEIARAAVRILNHLGIEPQVMADERCCGHDQLWEGDTATFEALARLNLERIRSTGAKRIVTACPECARTLKMDYSRFIGNHGLEVLHITELIAQNGAALSVTKNAGRVTFQDPCRLGRHLGVYEAPRQVLASLGFELAEMPRHGSSSQCCGTSCWHACGQVSKDIQVDRLEEARATGAEMLVTACLKCQIHLKCAQNDPRLGEEIDIPIRDLTTLVAEQLTGQSKHSKQEVPFGKR